MKSRDESALSPEVLLESLAHAAAVFGIDGRLMYENEAMRRLFGTDTGAHPGWIEAQLGPLLLRGIVPTQEADFRRHGDAETWRGVCSARPIRPLSGPAAQVMVTVEDVTWARRDQQSRLDTEERLRAANAELVRSNEELQQFAFAVSHELQEPLSAMDAVVEQLMARRKGELDDETGEYLAFIRSAAARMREMIHGLLAYARAGHRHVTGAGCDAGAALLWAVNQVEPELRAAGANIEHDPLPAVAAEFDGLTQVFQHLLSNALKYRGGKSLQIHVSAESDGDQWKFSFSDNGPGIDPAYHDGVFRVFKRLHGREVPGAGVGLAVCRRIIESFGGRIWVESVEGGGSRFCFTLPQGEVKRVAATGSQRA